MIAKLRNRVTVKNSVKVSNGRGGWTTREEDLGEKWAALLPISLREITQYQQLDKTIDTRIVMRRDPAINTDTIIYFQDMRYKVDTVLDRLNYSDFMEILAQGEKI